MRQSPLGVHPLHTGEFLTCGATVPQSNAVELLTVGGGGVEARGRKAARATTSSAEPLSESAAFFLFLFGFLAFVGLGLSLPLYPPFSLSLFFPGAI